MNPAAEFGLFDIRTDAHEEVSTMAATIDVEIESGVFTAPLRRHQGYWAGDLSTRPPQGDAD